MGPNHEVNSPKISHNFPWGSIEGSTTSEKLPTGFTRFKIYTEIYCKDLCCKNAVNKQSNHSASLSMQRESEIYGNL